MFRKGFAPSSEGTQRFVTHHVVDGLEDEASGVA
jgi:hypothetical protein